MNFSLETLKKTGIEKAKCALVYNAGASSWHKIIFFSTRPRTFQHSNTEPALSHLLLELKMVPHKRVINFWLVKYTKQHMAKYVPNWALYLLRLALHPHMFWSLHDDFDSYMFQKQKAIISSVDFQGRKTGPM